MILLLFFQFFGAVSSCARIYEVCCSSIQKTDNVKPRFDNPDILYTEPQITIDSSCGSAQIDCTLPGLDSEVYYLIYTDGNGNVLNAKGSISPIFNTSTANISCSTGYQNKDVYLSCEQGCTFDVCGHYKDCSCNPLNISQEIPRRVKRQMNRRTNFTVTYDDVCQNITIECIPNDDPSSTYLGLELFYYAEKPTWVESLPRVPYKTVIPDLKCVDSLWNKFNTTYENLHVLCTAVFK